MVGAREDETQTTNATMTLIFSTTREKRGKGHYTHSRVTLGEKVNGLFLIFLSLSRRSSLDVMVIVIQFSPPQLLPPLLLLSLPLLSIAGRVLPMFLYQSVCFISVLRKITFITFVSLKSAISVNLFFLANSRPVPPPLSRGRFLHCQSFTHTW